MPRSHRLLLPLAAALALAVTACADEECGRICPPGQMCVLDNGVELCLEANCGGIACAPGTQCVNDVCVEDQACTGCAADQHCVSGVCVDRYTSSNICDPLRGCRRECGTNIRCLDACEADTSATCASCLDTLGSCEQRQDCDSGAVNGCCENEFCSCFPSAPGCGRVADCLECQQDCSNVACFNECRRTDLACNLCLQPFDECRADTGGTCQAEFCDCLDPALEEGCAG